MVRLDLSIPSHAITMSSFVMGVELLLLIGYVRVEIATAAKRTMEKKVKSKLGSTTEPVTADEMGLDAVADVLLEEVKDPSVSAEDVYMETGGEGNKWMSTLIFVLLAIAGPSLTLLALSRRGKGDTGFMTVLVSGLASMTVILATQYGFVKLFVLPFYADTFNKVMGEEKAIPRLEIDDAKTTGLLLTPTLISFAVTIFLWLVGWKHVASGTVMLSALAATLSIATEAVAWTLMKGMAVPMEYIAGISNDASIAISAKGEKEAKIKKLHEAFFHDFESRLTPSSYPGHLKSLYWDRKQLKLDEKGEVEVAPANYQNKASTIVMLASAATLISVPLWTAAFKAPGKDAVSLLVQCAVIAASYSVFVMFTGRTTTMRKISTGLH
eukprot:jgi/Mesvir1/690/Mv17302-RA.1